MHSVAQFIVEQFTSGVRAFRPFGCCIRQLFAQALSLAAHCPTQMLSAAHSVSFAQPLSWLQHLLLMHVVQTSSSVSGGQLPGGPPPAPPVPDPVVVVPVAAVLVVLPDPPADPPFPPSSDPLELLDELH